MGCRLQAVGMVSALGRGTAEHLVAVTERLNSPLAAVNFSGRSAFLGVISGALPEVPRGLERFRSRNSSILLAALREISDEVISHREHFGRARIGVVIGSSTSGIASAEASVVTRLETGALPADFYYEQQEMGSAAAVLAAVLELTGPCYAVSTACSSGAKVFHSARALLDLDLADAVVVGGGDSLCRLTVEGFSALDLLSPERTNPFSSNRRGINIGEGAALFLLTRDPEGVQLLGVGESSDAHHMSAPDPTGKGAITAMQLALEDAGLSPEEISYLNLHGTGTPANDLMEGLAVRELFPAVLPVSSTKPFTGHTLGASGAIEVGICRLALDEFALSGELPLPVHLYDGEYDTLIPALDVVSAPRRIRPGKRAYCMSNSFGFGGSNCSVVLGVKR